MKLALEIGIYTPVKGMIKYYGQQYKSVRSTLLTDKGGKKYDSKKRENDDDDKRECSRQAPRSWHQATCSGKEQDQLGRLVLGG